MIRTELTLRLPNSPGSLASICQLLADERVTIIAMTLNVGGHLHLIVDNPLRAAGALRDGHHSVTERDVVFVSTPQGPGGLAPVLALVRNAGVNIEYAYGGGGEGTATAAVVIGVDDAQRAAAIAGV
jgi:hypothetical protein